MSTSRVFMLFALWCTTRGVNADAQSVSGFAKIIPVAQWPEHMKRSLMSMAPSQCQNSDCESSWTFGGVTYSGCPAGGPTNNDGAYCQVSSFCGGDLFMMVGSGIPDGAMYASCTPPEVSPSPPATPPPQVPPFLPPPQAHPPASATDNEDSTASASDDSAHILVEAGGAVKVRAGGVLILGGNAEQ